MPKKNVKLTEEQKRILLTLVSDALIGLDLTIDETQDRLNELEELKEILK